MSLSDVAAWLACPVCGRGLSVTDRTLLCDTGHAFDLAKQGYVNLLGHSSPANADTADMVAARARFLDAGHYRPIADAIASRTGRATRLLEVGAGTGYYVATALEAQPLARGLATDVSPAACRRAARAHARLGAVVADTWAGLPVRSSAVDALLCVFAPRNPAEFFRVLSPGGVLVVATPTPRHLASLRAEYNLLDVRLDKAAELRRSLSAFDPVATQLVEYRAALPAEAVADLVGMGPNAFHTPAFEPQAATIEVSVEITVLRKPGLAS